MTYTFGPKGNVIMKDGVVIGSLDVNVQPEEGELLVEAANRADVYGSALGEIVGVANLALNG